jgi:hypothetical protein
MGNLAAACAETGDFKGAISWQEKALADEDYAAGENGEGARKRLEGYRKGIAYHEE